MSAEAVWLISGIFVASTISGMTGLGFPTVATPLFVLAFDPVRTVALTALCSLTGQIISMLSLRREIAYTVRWPLVLGGLAGVPAGLALLSLIDKHMFGAIAGTVIVGASAWWLCKPGLRLANPRRGVEVLAGLAGGLCGGLTGVSAPIPTIWCAACGMTKERQRSVLQPFILIIQLSSGIFLWQHGVVDDVVMHNYALLIGPVICGAWLGARAFHAFTHQSFVRVAMGLTAALRSGADVQMIYQHPALDTARQRRAEAVATLLMCAASQFVLFVRDVQRRLLPRRRDDPAAHGISLPAECDEAKAES